MKVNRIKKTVLGLVVASTALMPMAISANDDTEKTNQKEESVYVVSDAFGKQQQVVVSGWLKNNTKAAQLIDECNLSDVVNVKGKQKVTTSNGVNTWQAKGNDIYYQGSATTQVPVGLNVTYTLDGKEMNAKDMLNKSGEVEIKVSYYNQTKVNYKGNEYTVPMLMATGMVLDGNKFSNVSIDNGKIINDGSRYLVAGFGVTGLNESLGLKKEIIPTSFTLHATVKKFTTSEMITYAGNDMLNELDLSHVSTLDELLGAINQLGNASTQLVDGSSKLADGVATLANKSTSLVSGVSELDRGANTLTNGLTSLTNGLESAKQGSEQLVNGLTKVSGGIDQLMQSRAMVAKGLNDLATGMDKANQALAQSVQYNQLVNQYLQGLQVSMGQVMSEEQKAQLAQVIQANQGSIAYQQAVQTTLSDAQSENTLRNGVAKLQAAMAESGENTFGNGLATLKAALTMTAQTSGQSGLIEGMQTLQAGIDSAYAGSTQLTQGASALSKGTSILNHASGELVGGINELNSGAQTLKNGMAEFNTTGIQKLVSVFNGDVKALTSQLNNVLNAGKQYQSFSGLSEDMNGSVKFIIKTAGIE
ncbi:MAG: hypothetical protein EOM50_04715 [Erysipelotrichia bacterium]|nr:hypothetical protein [Erysipelotrichia bacterium]NCC54301.1 hypothetical protein [Erysipelotrichia bacterium]